MCFLHEKYSPMYLTNFYTPFSIEFPEPTHFFSYFTTLPDWSRNFPPLPQPIKRRVERNCHLITCAFPRLNIVWLLWVLIGLVKNFLFFLLIDCSVEFGFWCQFVFVVRLPDLWWSIFLIDCYIRWRCLEEPGFERRSTRLHLY